MSPKKSYNFIVWSLFFLGCYGFYKYIYDGTEYVKSTIDNNYYRVRSVYQKQQKANILAILYIKLNTIVSSLERSNSDNPNVQQLVNNWNNGVSIKETGKLETDAAYVINKKYISFCLPDTTGALNEINLMTYVAIHELAHIMSFEIGHGPEFVRNFDFLLRYAKTLKYLDPITNTYIPVYIQLDKLNTANNFCGVKLVNSIN
jgi:hypothetical protein